MIIWLASYPRSGNTALRGILHRVFGIETYSLYDDKGDIGSRAALRDVVGHKNHNLDQQEFYAQASASDKTYFVKTHDAPQDDAKAIYVVRDGRAAAVSYFHYLKKFSPVGNANLMLKDIILGNCSYNSWSEHYAAWAPRTRPNTLLLNFSEITANPALIIDAIGKFIGQPPVSLDFPKFEELQKADADFFRSGSDARNLDEIIASDLALFWILHGSLMKDLGYIKAIPDLEDLPAIFRSLFLEFSKQQRPNLMTALAISEADRAARLNVIYQQIEKIKQHEITIQQLNSEIFELRKPAWKKVITKLKGRSLHQT